MLDFLGVPCLLSDRITGSTWAKSSGAAILVAVLSFYAYFADFNVTCLTRAKLARIRLNYRFFAELGDFSGVKV
jgi:hypothetical protein